MDRQVTFTNRTNRYQLHERISHIGGDGWRTTQRAAIASMENGEDTFFTLIGGQRVNLIVATHHGKKYLKTENDWFQPNVLLELAQCG